MDGKKSTYIKKSKLINWFPWKVGPSYSSLGPPEVIGTSVCPQLQNCLGGWGHKFPDSAQLFSEEL